MYKACIAVVGAARTRLFTFEREAVVEGLRERFVEVTELVNPRGGQDLNPSELDMTFVRDVVAALGALLRATACARLIVCARPKLLGVLREALAVVPREQLIELPRDLSRLTPASIREHLVDYELLPSTPPRRPLVQLA